MLHVPPEMIRLHRGDGREGWLRIAALSAVMPSDIPTAGACVRCDGESFYVRESVAEVVAVLREALDYPEPDDVPPHPRSDLDPPPPPPFAPDYDLISYIEEGRQ
jgi:hypothetical protein